MSTDSKHFETLALHGGTYRSDPATGAVALPIYQANPQRQTYGATRIDVVSRRVRLGQGLNASARSVLLLLCAVMLQRR